jgi:hypothetical protein
LIYCPHRKVSWRAGFSVVSWQFWTGDGQIDVQLVANAKDDHKMTFTKPGKHFGMAYDRKTQQASH